MRLAAYSVSPSPNPLPLGEGLRLAPRIGRAMSFPLATPAAVRSSNIILIVPTAIPVPHHHSRSPPLFPFPTVIPAKAGIHTRPLFARRIVPTASAAVLDSGLRRNDGGGAAWRWGWPGCRHPPGFWIPAYAGMTVGGVGMTVGAAFGAARAGANPPNPPSAEGGLFVGACCISSDITAFPCGGLIWG